MKGARSDVRRPDARRVDHSAGSPEGAATLILQRTAVEPSTTLWDQAFPAASWRSVLGGREVTVEVEGRRPILRGSRDGRTDYLGPVTHGGRRLTRTELEHDWLWLDGDIRSVTWSVEADVELPPVTVVVPTYKRERDATEQVRRFTSMSIVDAVVVVDQGGTLATHPGFTLLRASTDAIRLVVQENLGGSGGYARGMLEASQDPGSAVLFSDDDAVISEESLRRMLTYQALTTHPTILGTPLFSAKQPTRLIAHTETVRAAVFQWTSADHLHGGAGKDLAGTTPADWSFLALRGEANYTGWWGTLFPPGTAAELGLPVPLFLKWDDAEYGLRATARGYVHVVLPGTAVHHPPWNAYRTQMTWTARILHRNRFAIAAAYGAGRGVIGSSLVHQCKHILSGHLLTAELWEEGIDAFRAGPDAWLGSDLQRARSDGSRVVAAWLLEHGSDEDLTPTRSRPPPLPRALARSLARMVLPDRPPRVVLALASDAVHWRATLGADAVVITDDDGVPVSTFLVRGSDARHALVRTLRSHSGLALRWPLLRRQYRRALPRHTTTTSWAVLFGAGPEPEQPDQTVQTDQTRRR
ncbi:glycosyltransferase [Brachybacterium sp. FME24]|uniref:glycosyltransferase n=1 Tax=Brachybacterium sp. FME24 TaxID=2742605 RepID=UPI001868E994|nr:glycosyltransferase [Brachybacterium sp. FME24]